MGLVSRQLLASLKALPRTPRYLVAFSGGLDSQVLLHALAGLQAELLPAQVGAVHVHHGLQPQAEAWTEHARRVCEALALPLRVIEVDARARRGESPEAAAREARYAALRAALGAGEILLTAHHQDDQAETLLLQLLRGAGPKGLAAMPALASFGSGWLARPLLAVPRAALRRYAECHHLRWVEDPSNLDSAYDRNYLRHEVIPRLCRRWPGMGETLARAARLQAEAQTLLEDLARLDLAGLRGPRADTLVWRPLTRLSAPRQRNLLRHWLRELGLPVPAERRLDSALQGLLAAGPDRSPRAAWPGAELRRYRHLLYALAPRPAHDPGAVIPWDGRSPLCLPGASAPIDPGELRAQLGRDPAALPGPLTLRFRRGGERCRPRGRRHHHALKKLFQEAGVPPWERDRVPLLYAGERLVLVVGHWPCEP